MEDILGPFSDIANQVAEALLNAVHPNSQSNTLWWPLLLLTALMTVALLYALNGNFRHYHVSFRYPRWLEYWIQSPGMHHTHHSYLEKHWDTNLGLVTSVWDRLFGTLYIAERYEETPWGLSPKDQARYTSLSDNLITPFKEIGRILASKLKMSRQ